MDLRELLGGILPAERIRTAEPMARHTTFGVGGPADWFLMPETAEKIAAAVKKLHTEGVPVYILGGGADLLVRDKGIRGAVIWTGKCSGVKISETFVTALAGTPTALVAKTAADAGLSGLEFAAGIPGTIGGAAFMNAGAFDGDMSKIVKTVTVCDETGDVHTYQNEELDYAYRHSRFMEKPEIILEIEMKLTRGNREDIEAKTALFQKKRRDTQPLQYKSAGSTFKRPDGVAAAKLIDEAGLKGFSVGDAAVSEKHAGFIINRGHATCADILEVMETVRARVSEIYGIELSPEVRIIGEE